MTIPVKPALMEPKHPYPGFEQRKKRYPTLWAERRLHLETTPAVESFERISESSDRVGGAAHLSSQFQFGGDDKHNWQGRSDERIKLAVMTALHWDLAVPRDRLQVSVTDGWVTLTGRVARAYEKSRAEADAGMVASVAGVVNKITCDSSE
jgi:osmotically-inducible protein OsmY